MKLFLFYFILFCFLGCMPVKNEKCISQLKEDGLEVRHSFPHKKELWVDEENGIQFLVKVVRDWDLVLDALYAFEKKQCLYDLTIEDIVFLGQHKGDVLRYFKNQAGYSDNDTLNIFSLSTNDTCNDKYTKHNPGWLMSYVDGEYKAFERSTGIE